MHWRNQNQRVLVFLNRLSIAHEGERRIDILLVERLSPEKIKIDGDAMAKMKRYRGSSVQYEGQSWSGRKQRPDLSLGLGQNFRLGLKIALHRTISAQALQASPSP